MGFVVGVVPAEMLDGGLHREVCSREVVGIVVLVSI